MKRTSILLAGAMVLTVGAFAANDARAETIYTAPAGATVTTTTAPGNKIVKESYTAIGTRKVGRVGSRPYPVVTSHVENNTVVARPADHATTVTYAAPGATTTSVSTTTTTQEAPIHYSSGGGTYYTEYNTHQYDNPALNIRVRPTGSFNN